MKEIFQNQNREDGPEEKMIFLVLTGLSGFKDWLQEATLDAKHFAKNILQKTINGKKHNQTQKELFRKAIELIDNTRK